MLLLVAFATLEKQSWVTFPSFILLSGVCGPHLHLADIHRALVICILMYDVNEVSINNHSECIMPAQLYTVLVLETLQSKVLSFF